MQITRASSTLTRPITPLYSNISKVNESLSAQSQRTGFDSTQVKEVVKELDQLEQRIKIGNPLLWPDLYRLEAKVKLFLNFLNDEDFHNKYKKGSDFDTKRIPFGREKNAFEAYLEQYPQKPWFNKPGMGSDFLINGWVKYIQEINSKNSKWSTPEFIKEWTTILERIQALNNTKN
jgi:hypothetical protein